MNEPRDIDPVLSQFHDSLTSPLDRELAFSAVERLAEATERSVTPAEYTAHCIFSPDTETSLPREIRDAIDCGATLYPLHVETRQDATGIQHVIHIGVDTHDGLATRSYSVGVDRTGEGGLDIDPNPTTQREAFDALLGLSLSPAARTEMLLRTSGRALPITYEALQAMGTVLHTHAADFASQTEYQITAPTDPRGNEICDVCTINISRTPSQSKTVIELQKYNDTPDATMLIGRIEADLSSINVDLVVQQPLQPDEGIETTDRVIEGQAAYDYATAILQAITYYLNEAVDDPGNISYESLINDPRRVDHEDRRLTQRGIYNEIPDDDDDAIAGMFDDL